MFSNILITLLVSTLVFNYQDNVFCTNKINRTDALNTLLESSGWNKIGKVEVRIPNKEGNSFSIKDLLYRNAESDKIVNDNNYTEKYDLICYVLSCVYSNTLVKFLNFTRIIANISKIQRKRLSADKCRKKSQDINELNGKTNLTDEDDKQSNEGNLNENNYFDIPSSSVQNFDDDYTGSWKIFNSAVKQLKKSWLMFEYMFEAFNFLKELVPPEYSEKHLPELLDFRNIVSFYRDVSTDIKLVLPDYNGVDDNCHEDKISEVSRRFSIFLNNTQPLERFLNEYCIIPENDKPLIVKEKDVGKTFLKGRKKIEDKLQAVQQLELKIELLVNTVAQSYFKDLGFMYDFTKE